MSQSIQIVIKNTIAICIFMAGGISCQKKETPTVKSEYGYQLIKSERYGEAIDYFKDLNSKHPSPEYQVGLASAYSGRAGINVDKYWSFTVGYKRISEENFETEVLNKLESFRERTKKELSPEETIKEKQLAKVLVIFEIISQRFREVPIVDETRIDDVHEALKILEHQENKGVSIFRSILGVVNLRYEIEKGSKSWSDWIDKLSIMSGCTYRLRTFSLWAESIVESLAGVAKDLKNAFPSQILKIDEILQELNQAQKWIEEQDQASSESDRICE